MSTVLVKPRARTRFDLSNHDPSVVVLCGSGKFRELFQETAEKLSLEGEIVVMPVFTRDQQQPTPELQVLHLRRIDMANRVFVINHTKYIGESTALEIAYAKSIGCPVQYLEPDPCATKDRVVR